MRAAPQHFIEEVNTFLTANGVTLFSRDWLIPDLWARVDYTAPTIILAPSDVAIQRLIEKTQKSWPEIVNSLHGTDILQNHLSTIPTKREWPMITGVNSRKYGATQADIEALGPGASLVLRPPTAKVPLVVLVVNRALTYPDQLERLMMPEARGDEIPRMGKDLFMKMIVDNQIVGRDIIALCGSSSEIRSLCDRDDQALFKRLLKVEFNFDYDRGFAKERPRELYAKFHVFRLEAYISRTFLRGYASPVSSNYILIKNSNFVDSPVVQEMRRTTEVISLPLEGWFAENANKPDDPRGQNSLSLFPTYEKKRAPTYLIYVHGRPETATLYRRKVQDPWGDMIISFESSNQWLADYFRNKHLAIMDPKFRGIVDIAGTVKKFLEMQSLGYQIEVATFDKTDIIIAVIISNNQI